jgi:hypothetical protein
MADDDIRDSATESDDEAVLDPSLGTEHSAFLDDEELHEQLTDDGEGDERTALTAAHQGSSGTSTPAAEAAAFNAAGDADLLNTSPGNGNLAASAAARAANGSPAGDPANALQGELGLEAQFPDGDSSSGNGRGTATATEHNPGTLGAADADTIDDLQPGGDSSNPAGTGPSGPNGATGEDPSLQSGLITELDSGTTNSDDGLGGSGDQGAQTGGGSGDDNQEEYTDDDGSQSDGQEAQGGGGGVNPIIGDRFDNNLVGTDGRDMINAQDGNDTISAGAGDDLVMGKKGDDWIEGGLGDDTLKGGHGDDTFAFTDGDFDGNAWTDVDGAGAGAEATNLTNPTEYTNGGEFSGSITFDDGSTIVFDNIEKVDW